MDKSDFVLARARHSRLAGGMLAWSSLLVQKIDLRLRGLVIRKLRVNRHRVAEVEPHTHPHGQAILFLSGEGMQIAASRTEPARPGDLFIFPAGCEHGYQPTGRGRPICLVLDYERVSGAKARRRLRRHIGPAAMNELHTLVSRLPRKGGLALRDYATVAATVALLFGNPSGGEKPASLPAPAPEIPLRARIREILGDPAREQLSMVELARRIGYEPDYLNRKLRRESGQGLRELRDSIRFETALRALRSGASVGDAAALSGFTDPAYFARWFRKRTGKTPGASRAG